nr:uncharacterized protein LOC133578688 [Nerophis lumbriciformis]
MASSSSGQPAGAGTGTQPFSFYAYLLNRNSEVTPVSSEEFELAQAGLGKRHVTMSKDMCREEIFGLFQNEFPKMQGLTGGWLLHKATGGQGKRKLIMIPPDSNGYTGTQIRNVTGSGKMTLYIVPLQHQFDLTPLPPDAIEFEGMPKAQCQTCKVSFPFQILALHVKECMGSQTSEEDTEVKVSQRFCAMEQRNLMKREKAELITDDTNGMNQENEEELIKSVDDVLETICGRVDAEKRFTIQITRTNLFERGLLQWQRQKKNSPTSTLEVTFLGEAGVDTGALRKEFLTEMVAGIERRFFEGLQNQKSPRYSLNDFDNGLYRTVGEIFAVSLAQGGPAPTFFSPWTYTYLSGGQTNPTVLNSDAVADVQLRNLIDQVTAEFIMASISPVLSDKGTTRRQTELELVNYIQDFLYEGAEDQEEIEPRHGITPSRFLQWITGQGHIPILPSEKKDFAVIVKFNHDCSEEHGLHRICYPVISACAKTITLPVKHMRCSEILHCLLREGAFNRRNNHSRTACFLQLTGNVEKRIPIFNILFSPQWVIIPTKPEDIKVPLQAWKKNVLGTEEVDAVRGI